MVRAVRASAKWYRNSLHIRDVHQGRREFTGWMDATDALLAAASIPGAWVETAPSATLAMNEAFLASERMERAASGGIRRWVQNLIGATQASEL